MRAIRDEEKIQRFHTLLDSLDGTIATCNQCPSIEESLHEMSELDCQLRNTLREYSNLVTDLFHLGENASEQKTDKFRSVVQRMANIMTGTRMLRERIFSELRDETTRQFPAN